MASPEIQERQATIDRSLIAAVNILDTPGVQELLEGKGYADIDQLLKYLYVPNIAVGKKESKIITPRQYKNDFAIPITASFRKETIRLNRTSASLHGQQVETISRFATSNGLQDGEFLDKAKQAVTESFNDNRTLAPLSPHIERLVAMEGSVDVASHDHRVWGRPALILASGAYDRERHEGFAAIELLLHAHQTLSRNPTLAVNLETENKSNDNEIVDIMKQIAAISIPTKARAQTEETSSF